MQDTISKELSEMLGDKTHFCECCQRSLNNKRIKWLELNCSTAKWSDPSKVTVPEKETQGCFPFGSACASKRLRNQN